MSKQRKLRKIAVFLLIFLLSTVAIFALSDIPSQTAEIAFRRLEKQNLIGPAEIITTMDFENSTYDHLMVGRSNYGYTFFEWGDSSGWDKGRMTYAPKQEGATLYCTYKMYGTGVYDKSWLPIFAFTDHPAASAKLTLITTQDGETVSYTMEATRSEGGYFLFSWESSCMRGEDFWLVQQLLTGEYRYYELTGTAQAMLELYNSKGELVETHQFPAGQ